MEPLAELIPPFAQFTTGVPVDPEDSSLFIVDGVVNALPMKGQEERAERIDWINNEFGTSFKFALKNHKGRRTGSSKCMSIAASYLGDWWTVRTGNELPSYVNGVGGQMEYGFNPRMLECRFYEKANERHFLAKYLGNFKVAPKSKDRVTGESVPYSPRGYSRILTETNEGSVDDNLVSTAVKYETFKNHFSMDQKPHIAQIFIDGLFPKRAIKSDLKDVKDPDFPFTLHKDYGKALDVNSIKEMLKTWGPLLGQHMGRNGDGTPKTTRFGMGVHCIMIVGTGLVNGEEMLVYRETFGNASSEYLEDSFLGPSFRAMPLRFFYQAIAFPHHLYVEINDLKANDSGELGATVTVKTNRGMDSIDVDSIEIFVDGELSSEGRAKHLGNGQYRLWLPGSSVDASKVDVRVSKKYFADKDGNNSFGAGAEKSGSGWNVSKQQLSPVKAGL
jgi:archaellum component FlaF (FlaF/FlaG flagellin family)